MKKSVQLKTTGYCKRNVNIDLWWPSAPLGDLLILLLNAFLRSKYQFEFRTNFKTKRWTRRAIFALRLSKIGFIKAHVSCTVHLSCLFNVYQKTLSQIIIILCRDLVDMSDCLWRQFAFYRTIVNKTISLWWGYKHRQIKTWSNILW